MEAKVTEAISTKIIVFKRNANLLLKRFTPKTAPLNYKSVHIGHVGNC